MTVYRTEARLIPGDIGRARGTGGLVVQPSAVATTRRGSGHARRRPGAHREPGSNPWRTGLREIVLAMSGGRLVLWRARTRARRA